MSDSEQNSCMNCRSCMSGKDSEFKDWFSCVKSGYFHPLPEKEICDDWEISYDDLYDMIEGEGVGR